MFLKKIHYNSPVILTYTFLAFAILMLGYSTGGQSTKLLFCVYNSPLSDPLTYFRLFGHVLGHASFEHFFGNFLLILVVGPILEEKYGSVNILIMMLTTALITGLLNFMFFSTGLLGASGIVFMLIVLSSFVNLQKGRIPLTFILIIVIYIGKEIYESFLLTDNISRLTHVVGGICGAILGFAINKSSGKSGKDTE